MLESCYNNSTEGIFSTSYLLFIRFVTGMPLYSLFDNIFRGGVSVLKSAFPNYENK